MGLAPGQVGKVIPRANGGGIGNAMIFFISGHGAVKLQPDPYFIDRIPPPAPESEPEQPAPLEDSKPAKFLGLSGTEWGIGFALAIAGSIARGLGLW